MKYVFSACFSLLFFFVQQSSAQFVWKKISPNFEDGGVASFVINPKNSKTIYLTKVYENGIYRTQNGGDTWDSIGNVMAKIPDGMNSGRVLRLFVSPHDTTVMLAASDGNSTIFRSSDAGMNWHKAIDTMGAINSESIFFHPTIPGLVLMAVNMNLLGDEYHYPGSRIKRSTDYGKTWENVVWWRTDTTYSRPAYYEMAFFCGMTLNQSTGDIFLGGSHGRILRSTDNGVSWNLQFKPSEDLETSTPTFRFTKTPTIRFSKVKPNIGFATYYKFRPGSRSALLKTTDYGITWKIHRFFEPSDNTDTTLWAMDVIDAGGTVEVALMTYGTSSDGFLAYSKNEGSSFSYYQNPTWTPSFFYFPSKIQFMPRTPEFKGRNIIYCETSGIWAIDMDAPVNVEDEETATTTAQVGYSNGFLHMQGASGEQSISLYDIMGKSIGTYTTNTSTIEIGTLPKGVYVCTVSGGAVQYNSKFVVY